MKKILFSIATSLALFACSSDQPGGLPEINEGDKYPVTFNVSAFSESISPLKANVTAPGSDQKAAFTYMVYKSSGEFVKTSVLTSDYATSAVEFKDELEPGSYKVAFAMQYVQDGQAFAQPNINSNVSFTNATFEYSPSSDCFFKTTDLTVTTNGGSLNNISLPRITGAAEVYITNITSIADIHSSADRIKIGAFNIPNAFKISNPEQVISTSPNQFEKEFPTAYYKRGGKIYSENSDPAERAFPAVFSSTYTDSGNGFVGGSTPETFYRYIHTLPTNAMTFKITKGAEVKTISGFEIKANRVTKLKGNFIGQNNIDVSVNTDWDTENEQTY